MPLNWVGGGMLLDVVRVWVNRADTVMSEKPVVSSAPYWRS
ncbi:hypothetical protein [Amycolatopsis sp. lyj-23]